jgi:hypothetical protein
MIEDVTVADGDRLTAYFNRGAVYARNGDHDRATADFKDAVRHHPNNTNISFINRCLAVAVSEQDGATFYGAAVEGFRSAAERLALSRCRAEAALHPSPVCVPVDTACDGMAALPAALVPDESKRCKAGQHVAVSGTIQDIKRDKQSWSAGTIAHVDNCTGLTDPSTGFAALFGSGRIPSKCRDGQRFFATGEADYGREPEFFLKVRKITCD